MEMKQDYYLRISDKVTNEIHFREKFEYKTFREAKYQAEKYLVNDTALKRNIYPIIEVCLTTISSRKIIKNTMNWECDSNGNVSLKGWDNYLNGKKYKANKSFALKSAIVTTTFFIGFSVSSFLILLLSSFMSSYDNFNSIKSFFGILTFLLLLIYTGILPILKDEFNSNAETTEKIKWNNFKLEIPSIFATAITITNFTTEETFNQSPIYILLPVALLIALVGIAGKLMFENSYDIDRFYDNKRKHL
ncbi:hypothetical protein [uncultured Planococcus sp.]|uniref:hypothetical protein n=1 Tax=uncultured Planococcus sp. TaxID=337815 RepID=UPI00263A1A25|nr:hypothetical protein [uncultured Planococcus sp.]